MEEKESSLSLFTKINEAECLDAFTAATCASPNRRLVPVFRTCA
jgi:hypothetical protein